MGKISFSARLAQLAAADPDRPALTVEDDTLTRAQLEERADTLARDTWKVRIETRLRLSCTRDAFRLQAGLRAWEGDEEVCARDWDRTIARDCL